MVKFHNITHPFVIFTFYLSHDEFRTSCLNIYKMRMMLLISCQYYLHLYIIASNLSLYPILVLVCHRYRTRSWWILIYQKDSIPYCTILMDRSITNRGFPSFPQTKGSNVHLWSLLSCLVYSFFHVRFYSTPPNIGNYVHLGHIRGSRSFFPCHIPFSTQFSTQI